MRKSTKEFILTKPSTSGSNGNLYLETVTVRVKDAPSGTLEETYAQVVMNTAFRAIMDSIKELDFEILLNLNRISVLHHKLDGDECLHIVKALYSNILNMNERILDVLLPETARAGERGEEIEGVANKVRCLILKNQQVVNEVTGLISSTAESEGATDDDGVDVDPFAADSAGQNITIDTSK